MQCRILVFHVKNPCVITGVAEHWEQDPARILFCTGSASIWVPGSGEPNQYGFGSETLAQTAPFFLQKTGLKKDGPAAESGAGSCIILSHWYFETLGTYCFLKGRKRRTHKKSTGTRKHYCDPDPDNYFGSGSSGSETI
jgi:hypothetical protein